MASFRPALLRHDVHGHRVPSVRLVERLEGDAIDGERSVAGSPTHRRRATRPCGRARRRRTRTAPAQRRVEVVPRGIFGVPAEDVARDEPGLADAVEDLIAFLRLVGAMAGETDEAA